MRSIATSIRSWSSGSPRRAAPRAAAPHLEPLEERRLLDGQLLYGDFGGSGRPCLHYTCVAYSAIGMGSALSAALVMINLGNSPGPGQSPGDGQTPGGEPLGVPPADLQQLTPAPLPNQPATPGEPVAPQVPVVPDEMLDSIVRAVVRAMP